MGHQITPELLQRAIQETREFGEARCVRQRDGLKVRVYSKNGGGFFPIHGASEAGNRGEWKVSGWTEGGLFTTYRLDDDRDLVPVPVKNKLWLGIFKCADGFIGTEIVASRDAFRGNSMVTACIPIEFEDGEGLEGL